MTSWLGLPALASAQGAEIDRTVGLVHILMFVLFVGWGIFFLYTLWRFRRSRQAAANYQGVRSHTSTWLEVGVAAVEAVLLFGFSIPIWAKRVDHIPSERDALVVEVTAQQFAWNIQYPGPDGIFARRDIDKIDSQTNPLGLDRSSPGGQDDVVTLNQLYLPVDRPVIVKLRSEDVIHSFNLREFRVKQDAVPGFTIPVWFTPTVTTEEMRRRTGNPNFQYEIACAQLCGIGHYRMRGFVTIQSQDEFASWMAAEETKLKEEGGDQGIWD